MSTAPWWVPLATAGITAFVGALGIIGTVIGHRTTRRVAAENRQSALEQAIADAAVDLLSAVKRSSSLVEDLRTRQEHAERGLVSKTLTDAEFDSYMERGGEMANLVLTALAHVQIVAPASVAIAAGNLRDEHVAYLDAVMRSARIRPADAEEADWAWADERDSAREAFDDALTTFVTAVRAARA